MRAVSQICRRVSSKSDVGQDPMHFVPSKLLLHRSLVRRRRSSTVMSVFFSSIMNSLLSLRRGRIRLFPLEQSKCLEVLCTLVPIESFRPINGIRGQLVRTGKCHAAGSEQETGMSRSRADCYDSTNNRGNGNRTMMPATE